MSLPACKFYAKLCVLWPFQRPGNKKEKASSVRTQPPLVFKKIPSAALSSLNVKNTRKINEYSYLKYERRTDVAALEVKVEVEVERGIFE